MRSPTHQEAAPARDTPRPDSTARPEPGTSRESEPHRHTEPLSPPAQILGIFVGVSPPRRPPGHRAGHGHDSGRADPAVKER